MDTSSPFSKLHEALLDVQQSGQRNIDIQALQTFLHSIERNAPLNLEISKLQQDSRLAQYKADRDVGLEMLRAVLAAGQSALTTSILVNGGATVALLALIGNLYSKSSGSAFSVLDPLVLALVAFAIGVLFGAVATGATYATQYCYAMRFARSAKVFHLLTVGLVLISYLFFAAGIVGAYHAFRL